MAENSKIEWCTHTFNPWIGCTKVSPGCDRCYAEALMDHRYGRVKWGPHGERVRTSPANWRLPIRWARAARLNPEIRPRVFCASLADVFDNQAPDGWRFDLWTLIHQTPELDWLLLTKRPENIKRFLPWSYQDESWPNVWLGFTAEDQLRFDQRFRVMQHIPAHVRFCSYEPAIGSLRLPFDTSGLHWLICGGESGHGYRDMPDDWEIDIRQDCASKGVAYFYKQRSGKKPIPAGYPIVREFPEVRP